MRLTELQPRWVGVGYPGFVESEQNWACYLPIHCGVTFDCPHCKVQRLGVLFDPPINTRGLIVKDAPPPSKDQLVWKRESGETFDTLTLVPSLDFSGSGRIDFQGHWHGHITKGEVT